MDDENKPGTTIPLLHDMVYDPSLPLRPPKRPKRPRSESKQKPLTPPGYDPDTIDLFGDVGVDVPLSDNNAETQFVDQIPEDISADMPGAMDEPSEATAEVADDYMDQTLRDELADELNAILDDLNPPDSDKSA